MIRFLHVIAILCLVGSAGYAYSIKYDTLYYAEEIVKVRAKIRRERDAIAVAKAEWALLTRPDRLQRIVDQHLDLQPLSMNQLGRMADLPVRPPRTDAIGSKLDMLLSSLGTDGPAKPAPKPAPAGVATASKPAGASLAALAAEAAAPPPTATKAPAKAPSKAAAAPAPKPRPFSIEALLGFGGPAAAPRRSPRSPTTTGSIPSESAR